MVFAGRETWAGMGTTGRGSSPASEKKQLIAEHLMTFFLKQKIGADSRKLVRSCDPTG
jgi:hypothetical protein